MGKYHFEEMNEEYLDKVLQIYTYYVFNTNATFHTQALTREEMRDIVFFDSERYKTFVIFEENDICGYVLITQYKKREAYNATAEVTIYLKPEFKGKGIGSMAVKYIEEYGKLQEMHVLIATICGQNEESIRLFEKNGYNKCAHYREVGQKFGQLLDIVAYQKIIS
ncbi:MAG TPA: N-acetyltransferase family protein [Methylomusa anaerophila]|uniref:Phosphinothricin N-acetyltransferase n=1 Tax=Methylomusa anaerophila TaxID=1930071 RepID=A0A348AFW1_9FIRM|nr:GNAT family N-acetyltransferase [Methylomusa anaerophila]BBB89959.1 phosphinothricin N-acetyltransferase [Methylomusa anaerophila]HML88314.1 N-acetyltransferase family protein [Methylomusa anaerophila]